jgi:hypothetical protein
MSCDKMENRLHDYVDGLLPKTEQGEFERHLDACPDCRQEAQFLRSLRRQAAILPKSIAPPRDLWPEIAARIEPKRSWWHEWVAELRDRKNGVASSFKEIFWGKDVSKWLAWGRRGGIAAAVLVLAVGGIWLMVQTRQASWQVARLTGAPQVGSQRLATIGQLQVGEWIETDDSSRAKIDVGMIGHVQIEPNTRIGLVQARLTDHRLVLARGEMHAEICAAAHFLCGNFFRVGGRSRL